MVRDQNEFEIWNFISHSFLTVWSVEKHVTKIAYIQAELDNILQNVAKNYCLIQHSTVINRMPR